MKKLSKLRLKEENGRPIVDSYEMSSLFLIKV